ncbi:CDP-glycerol glycerophosphotransferase family protein [Siminovitchia acidinfaciens]|uniref:CDP-glycerol glycerophosphotransferase family protein n=1 Tax=Siminovitchia acidinfaciens TaxID=2321395 RepID=A0A429XZH9_9BACI|nr:CDP-glycerol glycerophosphotransferase family protein [Siminovitchia acidinfaciens]
MKKKLKKRLQKVYKKLFKLMAIILPKNKNLIVFESFLGKQYSDNPRAIYEYLKQHYPNYKMYWSVDKRKIQDLGNQPIKIVPRFSVKWLFLMTRAKYWVTNCRLPLWVSKPPQTVYVQTWHGTPLKRLGLDMDEVHMPGTNTKKYKRNFAKESAKWDYLISPNSYSTEIFRQAFDFKKKVIESGYPRNDFLIQSNNAVASAKIKSACGLPIDKKVILYAPTWRDNQYYSKGRYKFDLPLDLDVLKEKLGNEYIILLRLHYLVSENLDLSGMEDFVYDVSSYGDIRDLYLISDVLVTDYSSVFFDYANLKRPMVFFVHDIEEYRDQLRGFYFDFEKEAPGPLVRTTEGLIEEIRRIEQNGFSLCENFYQKFCHLEKGKASEQVVKEIFQ